jgi:hypothetical protein
MMNKIAVLLLFAASPALADLASQGGDSAASGAISRLASARQNSAAAMADKDVADVQAGQNLVYYSSLKVSGTPKVGDGFVSPETNDQGDNTAHTETDHTTPNGKPSPVPAPGAALLALIGFAGVNWLKRRA